MIGEILVLRLVHVLGGVFWVGSGLFSAFFLAPSLVAAGPAAGRIMAELQRRRMFLVLPTVAVLTILSGLRLMWIASSGFGSAYFASRSGSIYAISGAASIVAFLIALLIARPAAQRGGQLAGSLATMPEGVERSAIETEASRVRRRGALASAAAMWLLLLAAAGMAVARYV